MSLIALDVGSCRERPCGVGVYIRDLAKALVATPAAEIAYIGVRTKGPLAEALRGRPLVNHSGEGQATWIQRRADRVAADTGAGVAHWTNGMAPTHATLPYVLTIQDLSVIRFPRAHPWKRAIGGPLLLWSAMRARRIIVPSEATATELHRLVRIPARRIEIVPHAPSASLLAAAEAFDRDWRATLGIGTWPYVLCVGTFEPRKNHRRLVAAFESIAAQDRELRLVLVGGIGWHGGALDRDIARSSFADRIIRLGYLDEKLLAPLMATAEVAVYISLYEGFGLPVVEARALGTPVVTSSVSSLPEAAEGHAILVDPYDVRAIANGITRARTAGRPRSRPPARSWAEVARDTLSVYGSVG